MANSDEIFQVICLIYAFISTSITALMPFVFGAILAFGVSSGCVGFRFFGISLLFVGLAFVILFFSGCCIPQLIQKNKFAFLCCLVLWLLALVVLGVFALAVSSKRGGQSVQGRSYKEYHVESYSQWMQNKVKCNWDSFYLKAIVNNKDLVCNKGNKGALIGVDPAFESGCCEPPKGCDFNYTSSGALLKPEMKENYSNVDCKTWDSDPNTLCFNCESCKAGFLQDVTRQWFSAGLSLVLAASSVLLSLWLLINFRILDCYLSPKGYKLLGYSECMTVSSILS